MQKTCDAVAEVVGDARLVLVLEDGAVIVLLAFTASAEEGGAGGILEDLAHTFTGLG